MIDTKDADGPYDDFWLEIERDLERDLAAPPRGDPGNDAHRETVEHAMLADEERRRRPPNVDEERQQSKPASTAPDEKTATSKPDRSFPKDIENRYYVREDRNGDRRVFADSKGTLEIFQESENRLRTRLNDEHAVKLMLDTAAHRGWTGVTVKGAKEFRREAWLEGQARGIAVTGYKPNELDRQELKRREQTYLRNELAPTPERDRGERTTEIGNRTRAPDGPAPQSADAQDQPVEHTRADRRSFDYEQGIEGVLVEKGSRPYGDNEKNDPSPFVVLQDGHGRQHTVWGVGIPDALLKAGARQGDHIQLREVGMERVTKTVLREIDGKPTRINQEVNRRAWEAQMVQEREVVRGEIDERANDRDRPNVAEREAQINAAERRVDRAVVGAEKTLHVGRGRDTALEDGGYANEQRAREYMANGRASAATNPELRGAATMEAYVERKLRAQFPNDPTAVSRGMTTARTKISQVIARGQDFPIPRVVETRELDRATRERAAPSRDADPPREHIHERQRDETRERNRDIDRGR